MHGVRIVDELMNSTSITDDETIDTGAILIFNLKPEAIVTYLKSHNRIAGTAEEVALFIYNQAKLNKRRIGEFISGAHLFNQEVCRILLNLYDFSGLTLDGAVRKLVKLFRLPGEAQQIDRVLEIFGSTYYNQNPGVFLSAVTIYMLSFSIIMLNTDLHNRSLSSHSKMTLEQFQRNNSGIDNGNNISDVLLEQLYNSIKSSELKMDDIEP